MVENLVTAMLKNKNMPTEQGQSAAGKEGYTTVPGQFAVFERKLEQLLRQTTLGQKVEASAQKNNTVKNPPAEAAAEKQDVENLKQSLKALQKTLQQVNKNLTDGDNPGSNVEIGEASPANSQSISDSEKLIASIDAVIKNLQKLEGTDLFAAEDTSINNQHSLNTLLQIATELRLDLDKNKAFQDGEQPAQQALTQAPTLANVIQTNSATASNGLSLTLTPHASLTLPVEKSPFPTGSLPGVSLSGKDIESNSLTSKVKQLLEELNGSLSLLEQKADMPQTTRVGVTSELTALNKPLPEAAATLALKASIAIEQHELPQEVSADEKVLVSDVGQGEGSMVAVAAVPYDKHSSETVKSAVLFPEVKQPGEKQTATSALTKASNEKLMLADEALVPLALPEQGEALSQEFSLKEALLSAQEAPQGEINATPVAAEKLTSDPDMLQNMVVGLKADTFKPELGRSTTVSNQVMSHTLSQAQEVLRGKVSSGGVSIALNPENLGQVRIILNKVAGNAMNARFIVEQPESLLQLKSGLESLRQSLADQGIELRQLEAVLSPHGRVTASEASAAAFSNMHSQQQAFEQREQQAGQQQHNAFTAGEGEQQAFSQRQQEQAFATQSSLEAGLNSLSYQDDSDIHSDELLINNANEQRLTEAATNASHGRVSIRA